MNPTLKTATKLALTALTLQASTSALATYNIIPVDCTPGRVDNTCMAPIHSKTTPPTTPPVDVPEAFPLAGVPAQGYWFWGYDFSTADVNQSAFPLFVNRSGTSFLLTLGFTVPSTTCGGGCLPGVQYFVGTSKIGTVIPSIKVDGTHATATLAIGPYDYYGWVIGLWQATNPTITITTNPNNWIAPESVGLPAQPDQYSLAPGVATQCACTDGGQASCMNGDHASTGLIGQWRNGLIQRFNAWSACQRAGS